MTSSLVVDDVITCQGHPSMNTPHPKNCRKIVQTTEFRVKNVVNNNCQLYHRLLTYYIKSSFLKLSQFTNCTFLDIEWTRPGSLANPSVSLLSHRRSLSTQHHTLVSKINGGQITFETCAPTSLGEGTRPCPFARSYIVK